MGVRWYSEEAKKEEAKEEAKTEENGEVSELKKKFEAKDKEVVDLKVRVLSHPTVPISSHL